MSDWRTGGEEDWKREDRPKVVIDELWEMLRGAGRDGSGGASKMSLRDSLSNGTWMTQGSQ